MKIKLIWLFLLLPIYVLPNVLDDSSRDKPVVIMTTLAGRKENLKILFRYVDALLSKGMIDEYHIWNYAYDADDGEWIDNKEYFATLQNPDKFIVMPITGPKVWIRYNEYYEYYAKQNWISGDVFVRTDDDILYMDIDSFPRFIQKVRNNKSAFLTFANIINNGVCAYHQYNLKMQPRQFKCQAHSELFRSGKLCLELHQHFISHVSEVLQIAKSLPEDALIQLPIKDLFKINFYALLASDLLPDVFQRVAERGEEEMYLTMELPELFQRNSYIDPSLMVAHGAFLRQRQSGVNEKLIQQLYTELADATLSKENK